MARIAKTEITIEAPAPKQNRALSVIIVLAVLLALSVAIAGYFYYQYTHSAPVNSEADEVASLTKIIGAMMELPEGETPTLATVTDKDKLAEQPFFQKAENGDKVLIYTNSGRAILYRPSTGKIVDVTTVNVNTAEPAVSQSPESGTAAMPVPGVPSDTVEKVVVQNVSVALYNGSTKIGVTNTLEDRIKATFDNVEVIIKEKAAKNDYQGNLIIDLSGTQTELAQQLADSVGGTIGAFPSDEIKPDADILIIVGNKQ
ncbi:MAG: hypothetical protein AAB547_01765 [Patescibacteria group bacterium]